MPNQHHDAQPTGKLPFPPPQVPPDAPIEYSQFWQLWSEEKFYECHEVLEELWRRTPGRERWFLNGLINCAVAVYQHRRGNAVGAARQLLRAQVKLRPFAPLHNGVDVNKLLQGVVDEIAPSLQALTEAQRAQWPAVEQSIKERMARDFE
jgi:predicted metal-dependent hydrolase